jgi:hypothetical protein
VGSFVNMAKRCPSEENRPISISEMVGFLDILDVGGKGAQVEESSMFAIGVRAIGRPMLLRYQRGEAAYAGLLRRIGSLSRGRTIALPFDRCLVQIQFSL